MKDEKSGEEQKLVLQETEYSIPYHYLDLFAPAQSIERNSIFEALIKYLNVKKEDRILDIGCGDGRFCYYAKNYCNVEGIDFSERAISWGMLFNPEVKFHHGNLEKLQNSNSIYDGLVCIEVIEHIPDREIPSFLRSARAILKKGGTFVLTVPSKNMPLSRKHFRHYDEKDLYETLSPYFSVEIVGHSRMSGRHRKIMSVLNVISLLFYSETFCDKYPKFVNCIRNLKYNYWHKHLNIGATKECFRLIAVCRDLDQK